MESVIEMMKTIDIGQLIVMGAMLWFFYSRLDNKMEKLDNDMKEIRTSLNRMEGAFYSKDCCMLKEERQSKKAE